MKIYEVLLLFEGKAFISAISLLQHHQLPLLNGPAVGQYRIKKDAWRDSFQIHNIIFNLGLQFDLPDNTPQLVIQNPFGMLGQWMVHKNRDLFAGWIGEHDHILAPIYGRMGLHYQGIAGRVGWLVAEMGHVGHTKVVPRRKRKAPAFRKAVQSRAIWPVEDMKAQMGAAT